MKLDLVFEGAAGERLRHTVGDLPPTEINAILAMLATGVIVGDHVYDIVTMPQYNLHGSCIQLSAAPRELVAENLTPEQRRGLMAPIEGGRDE